MLRRVGGATVAELPQVARKCLEREACGQTKRGIESVPALEAVARDEQLQNIVRTHAMVGGVIDTPVANCY